MFTRCLVVCAVALLRGGRRPRRRRLFHAIGRAPPKAEARLLAGGPAQAAVRNPAGAGRHHLLARSRRFGRAAEFRFLRIGQSRPRRAGISRAHAHRRARRLAKRSATKRASSSRSRSRPLDPSKPVRLAVKRELRGVRETLPSRQGGLDPDAAPKRLDALRRRDRGGARRDPARASTWRALGGELASVDARRLAALPARRARPGARSLPRGAPRLVARRPRRSQAPAGATASPSRLREKPADGAFPLSARATITGGAGALDVMLIPAAEILSRARRSRDRLALP